MVDRMYQRGKGTNMASHFEIDDVIDPAEGRRWISAGLEANPYPTGARFRRSGPASIPGKSPKESHDRPTLVVLRPRPSRRG